MPTLLQSDTQTKIKNSYASAANLDLVLICNGEESTRVFDSLGNLVIAGIEAPAVLPSVADVSGGNLLNGKYIAYQYVYAATTRYRFVENVTAAGGDISPRSNPSPSSAVYQITGAGNRKLRVTVTKTTRSDITKIFIYRTGYFATSALAQTSADAGQLFYVGVVDNDGNVGTTTFDDNTLTAAGEQIENDNFIAPTAAFCIYYDPYFYIFGNFPLVLDVTLGSTGIITTTDEWFSGRNLQFCKLAGVTSGGYDGFGTFYFKYLTSTTAQLTTDAEGTSAAYIPVIGATVATIYGFSTVLYRSKFRNPFGWGQTLTVGTVAVPQLWSLKVGGGIGTGLAVLPSSALLKLDTVSPNKTYTLNLKLQDNDNFQQSQRILSDNYTTSLQHTQFATLNRNKQEVVWSLDLENFAIIECDGSSQVPISDPVFQFLRQLTLEANDQIYFHGIYDPYTECNFIWVKESGAQPKITHGIYQHVPTGQWGQILDFDLTASAILQDFVTKSVLVLGGTDTGFVGQILNPIKFINWLEEPTEANPNAYQFSGISSNEGNVIIRRTNTVVEEGEHLTFLKIYGSDGISAISTFLYYNLHASAPPSESAGFDNILAITCAAGDSAASVVTTIVTQLGSVSTGFSIHQHDLGIRLSSGNTLPEPSISFSYNTSLRSIPNSYSIAIQAENAYLNQQNPTIENFLGCWFAIESSIGRIVWFRVFEIFENNDYPLPIFFDISFGDINDLDIADVLNKSLTLWMGAIECKFQHSFDLSAITKRKTLREIWLAATEALEKLTSLNIGGTYHYYPNKLLIGFNDQIEQLPETVLIPDQDLDGNNALQDMYFVNKGFPSNPFKTFGMTVIQIGYADHKVYNLALKFTK